MSKLYDPARITPLGKELGDNMARLVQPEIDRLAAEGEPDERCVTCAFRAGTVPNGCIQTMADALKCVFEGERAFLCHMDTTHQKVCHGYFALRYKRADDHNVQMPWDYSPDEIAA